VRRDIEAGVALVTHDRVADKDGLCCGHLGRLDLLLSSATASGRGELAALSIRRAGAVMRHGRASGYRLSGAARAYLFDPSFFQGLSGVGYQLLRVAYPARLPSVLSFA
jgi:lantibiotic modifying enzyme